MNGKTVIVVAVAILWFGAGYSAFHAGDLTERLAETSAPSSPILAASFFPPVQDLALAQAAPTTEVLVLTTSTAIPRTLNPRSKGIEIFNNGPNDIFCAQGGGPAVVNKSRPVRAGGFWSLGISNRIPVNCIAATANQVTLAATIVNEAL